MSVYVDDDKIVYDVIAEEKNILGTISRWVWHFFFSFIAHMILTLFNFWVLYLQVLCGG